MQQLLQQAQAFGLKVQQADRDQLQKMAGTARHQGVVARCKLPRTKSGSEEALDTILEDLAEPAFLLVLDGVQDPHIPDVTARQTKNTVPGCTRLSPPEIVPWH